MQVRRLLTSSVVVIAATGVAVTSGCDIDGGEVSRISQTDEGSTPERERIVGLPCEGCEAVFDGLPAPAEIRSTVRIAPADEPGEPLVVDIVVNDQENRPAAGVIVYAYHTNARGVYPTDESKRGRDGYRHGRLRGWAKTDREGRCRFETIRPGAYPGHSDPQHIHMHMLEPGRCTYYISDIMFEDDPLLTEASRRAVLNNSRGGNGIVAPQRDDDGHGAWRVKRTITLGLNVPGYPAPGAR